MAKRSTKQHSTSKKTTDGQSSSRFLSFFKDEVTQFIFGLILFMFTVFAALSMISFFFTSEIDQSAIENINFFSAQKGIGIANWTGFRGAYLSNLLMNEWFGLSTFFMLFFFASMGLKYMRVKKIFLLRRFVFSAIATVWTSVALAFFLGYFFRDTAVYIGGKHGFMVSDFLKSNLGLPGTFIFLITIFIVIMIFVSAHTIPLLRKLFHLKVPLKKGESSGEAEADSSKQSTEGEVEEAAFEDDTPTVLVENKTSADRPFMEVNTTKDEDDFEVVVATDDNSLEVAEDETGEDATPPLEIITTEDDSVEDIDQLEDYDPQLELSHYQFPGIDLLTKYEGSSKPVDMDEQNANKNRIISTLESYGIQIKSIKATVGPTITLYEIVQADGIRISRIRTLEDDIAMSLSALGIRIIAPMPGKGTIGIEVPNRDPQIVSMASIIASKKFQETKFDLPIALGKTITNDVFMVDLCKLPHLLVAGATGQGKSVGLNAIITSLLYKKHPTELKFVMVDPKMVEFNIYSVIEKHYLAKLPGDEEAIITDSDKVINTLHSLAKEMDERYVLLTKANTRNIKEYNEKFVSRHLNPLKGHKYLPYIVVIIDEFGDLIMTAGKEIELPIARIAQKARAVGIHMVIATQRPTTNIITGTIKANFPARIAFKVATMVDSRTILDGPGANQLIGRGDMLYYLGSEVHRVQCAFVDTPEVIAITKHIQSQQAFPTAFILPEPDKLGVHDNNSGPLGVDSGERDVLFDEVARMVVVNQIGSTSSIQRRFSIGFNRAGRIMEQLEEVGIVGPPEGSKARDVLIPDEYTLQKLLNNL